MRKRGRRGEGEANPHIHHHFRRRRSLKFLQLPSSHLTGNISVQFPGPRNRWSFARLEPGENQTKPPATPRLPGGPRGGQFHGAVTQGQGVENGNLTTFFFFFQEFFLLLESGLEDKGLRKFSLSYFFAKKRSPRLHRLPNHHPKSQTPRVGKLRQRHSETPRRLQLEPSQRHPGKLLKRTPLLPPPRVGKHPRGA